jgi:hypothetical protein
MSDNLSQHANPRTRSMVPVQFFEADGNAPPPGTKATPRPKGRPRELPVDGRSSAALQVFDSERAAGTEGE